MSATGTFNVEAQIGLVFIVFKSFKSVTDGRTHGRAEGTATALHNALRWALWFT